MTLRAILFDMDGVLYNDRTLIPGAVETVEWVRKQGIPHLFVTNTSSRGRSVLVEKLGAFGIPAVEDEVLAPPAAAADWLRGQGDAPVALFVRAKARSEFAGLNLLPGDAESGARYVVIGDLEDDWTFRTINRAFRLLHASRECELIALGMTKYWLASDGLRLDVAPFVAALEHATGKKALAFGKPSPLFFQAAARRLRVPMNEIAMIGDDVETDVGGAQRAGLKGVLVRTGKYRPADLEGAVIPDAVLDSVADVPEWWKSQIAK
jgi:phospholysine phosphohistidine inorganic pyrophosphate phosphatase